MGKIKENWIILVVTFGFSVTSFFISRAVNNNDSEKISLQNDIEILKEVKADKNDVAKRCEEMDKRITKHEELNRQQMREIKEDINRNMEIRFNDLKDFIKANHN